MADNITGKTGDTPAQTVQMRTIEVSPGIHAPTSILLDAQGNTVSQNVARDLNNGLKVSVWFGDQNKPIVPVTINNQWAARVDDNKEYPFSTYNFLPVVAYDFAWDAVRTVSGQAGSPRKRHFATGAAQLAANDASPSYQGLTRSCQLFSMRYFVSGSTDVYLKLWDRNSAPTVGTDAPAYIIRMPAGNIEIPLHQFSMQSGYYFTFHTTRTGTTLVTAGTVQDVFLIHG